MPKPFIFMLCVIALTLTAAWAASADQAEQRSEVRGPTYSLRELREVEIEGVRLGMSEGTASDILAARGYTPVANGLPGQLNFYSADRKTRLAFDYANEHGPRIVESIVIQRSHTPQEMMDVEARRAEIVAMLGRPTQWVRSVDRFGYPYDEFYYTSNRTLAANFGEVWSCKYDWRCADDLDCRTYLRPMRNGGVISVSFSMSGYWLHAFDLSHSARELSQDQAFMARDLSGAVCPVPYIH